MLIGIDLLWVRPKICGGTESVIRNLINGFGMYDEKNKYLLFVGKDTADTFTEYEKYGNIKVHKCDVESLKRIKRIAWENMKLDKLARKLNVDVMLVPVYSKPNSKDYCKGGIPYVTVIHDFQAMHYPEYFSKMKLVFAKRSWKKACKESAKVVTISDYCRKDAEEFYPEAKGKTSVIYDPIVVTENKNVNLEEVFSKIKDKYRVDEEKYFYTVSSMLPHKNLDTLLRVMKEIKSDDELKSIKLVVSGVGGKKEEFHSKVKELGIEDMVIDTGFVSNEERDALYSKCNLFLFPSEFEGFGMPPIEAMMKGARVVTTKCSCLEEITQGKATYVDDSRDVSDWTRKIKKARNGNKEVYSFESYELKNVTEKYIEVLTE